jgi:hypothetical protein
MPGLYRLAIGFVGTRQGMTALQRARVKSLLHITDELHHGDCVGADKELHDLAGEMSWRGGGHDRLRVVIHPPNTPRWRAWCTSDDVRPPQAPMIRNHAIVHSCHMLLATPRTYRMVQRSSTWATVRYAVKRGRGVVIVLPDGSIRELNSMSLPMTFHERYKQPREWMPEEARRWT